MNKITLEDINREFHEKFGYEDSNLDLNQDELIMYIDALERIREYALTHDMRLRRHMGICFNMSKMVSKKNSHKVYMFISFLSVGWKHHSGRLDYPVDDDRSLLEWEGTNQCLRIKLVDYILNRLACLELE